MLLILITNRPAPLWFVVGVLVIYLILKANKDKPQ